jgi:hypothetical protein
MKSRVFVIAGVATALLFAGGLVGVASGIDSEGEKASGLPTVVERVPETIPLEGVNIDPVDGVVLMPVDKVTPSTSEEVALSRAPAIFATGKPVSSRAVLAYVTVGATLPREAPTTSSGENCVSIENRLAWVVTLTYPEPVNCTTAGGGEGSEALPSSVMKSHFNVMVDAETGEVIWGFFTD